MADGRWQMADGGWRMADGGWQMADGGWQMAERGGRGHQRSRHQRSRLPPSGEATRNVECTRYLYGSRFRIQIRRISATRGEHVRQAQRSAEPGRGRAAGRGRE